MNFKTTYFLFGTLVVLLAVAAVALMTGPKQGEEGLLLPALKSAGITAEKVTRVTLERKQPSESKQVFVKDGEQWKLEEPYAARLDNAAVERMITDLLNARRETKGADLSGNVATFGLDQPAMTVSLEAEGGRSATVHLGRVTIGSDALVYVATGDKPKEPAAVKRTSLGGLLRSDVPTAGHAGDLSKSITEFRAKDLFLADAFNPAESAKAIKLKGDKGEVALNKTPSGTWQFEKPAGWGEADSEGDAIGAGGDPTPTGIKPLLNALKNIRAVSNDDFIEGVTDFAQYGLEPGKEAGPRLEIVRTAKSGGDATVTEVVLVGKKEDKGDRVFVRPAGEAIVVKVPESLITPIKAVIEKPAALRNRSLLTVQTFEADGVDVQVGDDKPVELRKLGEPPMWKLFDAQGAAVNANTQAVTQLLNDLSGRRLVREFPDPSMTDAALGFDKPTATVTVWVNGVIKEEKKDEPKEPAKDDAKDKAAPKDAAKDKADAKDAKADPAKPEKKDAGPAKPKMKDPAVKLVFGKRDKDLLYVRRLAGGTKADLAIPASVLERVTRGRIDYLDPTLPSFLRDQVAKLTIVRDGETYVLERVVKENAKGPTWEIKQPAQYAGRTADESKVEQVVGELSGLVALKLWAEKPTDAELERAGLKTPKLQATIELKEGTDKTRVYQFGNESDDKLGVYAKQGERPLVFVARKSAVDALRQSDLLDPTVFQVDVSKVTGMKVTGWKDVVGEEKTLDMERKGTNNWSMKGGGNFKLSPQQAESFLTGLATVRADKFVVYKTGPTAEHKLTPAEGALKVELTIDGEKEPVTLSVGAADKDGKSYFAQSNKLPGDVFLLPKDRFEKWKARPTVFSAE